MPETVIDLDLLPTRPEPREAPGRRRLQAVGLLLAVTLLVVLAGQVLKLRDHVTLGWQADTVSGAFWVTDRAAYTVEPTPDGEGVVLVARDPLTGLRRWSTTLTGPLAASYAVDWQARAANFPPSLTLRTSSSIINIRDGQFMLGYPAAALPLIHLAQDVAVFVDRDPDAQTQPPPRSSIEVERGITMPHRIVAYDLATGAVRWTRRLSPGWLWALPGTRPGAEGIVALPPEQQWMVIYNEAGRVTTLDLRSGEDLAHLNIGPLDDREYVLATEDAVLVYAHDGEQGTFRAYDPATLSRRWQITPPQVYAIPFTCAEFLCLQADRSVWALDPRAGTYAWRLAGPVLRSVGGGVEWLAPEFGNDVFLVDAKRGRTQQVPGLTGAWRVVDAATRGSSLVLAQVQLTGGATLAALDLQTLTVRRLGEVTDVTSGTKCLATAAVVACENNDVVRVWH